MVFLGIEWYESSYIPKSVLSPIWFLNSLHNRIMTSATPFVTSRMVGSIGNECMKKEQGTLFLIH